jgi:biopolymer transport protein ExbD
MRIPNSYSAIFTAVLILPMPALMFDPEYHSPTGLPVYLPVLPKNCGDGRTIVLRVHGGGSLNLNMESVDRSGLDNRLKEIFATRAERLIFVKGDPELDFREVAQIIDIARTQTEYVALLTPSVEREMNERPFCCCLTIAPHKGIVHDRR